MSQHNGGGVDEYVSPFQLLPYTLEDEDARRLREAIYEWFDDAR